MNLMIVEDEPRLRHALGFNIPWDQHGIELVGLASNGLEALRLIELKKPDIILVDVQMPGMDGLTMLKELRDRHEMSKLMKFIILSGHDSFEFAQIALKQGAFRYLLKPAGEDEILESVLEARRQLHSELEQWRRNAALEMQWENNLPHLQNLFFLQWVNGKHTREEILSKSKELHIQLHGEDRIAVAVVDLDAFPEDVIQTKQEKPELLKFSMQCLAKELLSPSCWVTMDSDQKLLLLFIASVDQEPKEAMLQMNADLSRLLSQTKDALKVTASAGICASLGAIEDMHVMYEQACRALQERIVYGPDIVISYRESIIEDVQSIAVKQNVEKTLEIALETADEIKAIEALEGLWEGTFTKTECSDDFHEAVLYVNSLFTRMIQKRGWTIKQVLGEESKYIQNVNLLTTKTQTWSFMERSVKHIVAFMQEQRKTTSNQVVKEIINLLNEEMDQELTLHTVADRLYINSSYLSRLFKQEMGVAFSDYVLERKMKRAKSLLQEGYKVYDAASSVGYRDVSYFTKVFRKYWGVNPGEFKGQSG